MHLGEQSEDHEGEERSLAPVISRGGTRVAQRGITPNSTRRGIYRSLSSRVLNLFLHSYGVTLVQNRKRQTCE